MLTHYLDLGSSNDEYLAMPLHDVHVIMHVVTLNSVD